MTDTLRMLIIEDSASDAKLVAHALRRAGRTVEFLRVEDAPSMLAALKRDRWDVVISDWSMPRFSAIGALDVFHQTGLDLPFIVVSGTIGEETAVEAMRRGAHDFVLKDRLTRLVPAIEREIRECADRAARRKAEDALWSTEERYRRIVETTNEGVWMFDADAKTTFVNERMVRLLGVSSEDALGRKPSEFISKEAAEVFSHVFSVLQSGGTVQEEVPFTRPDGTTVFTLLEASPFLDASGKSEGSLAMVMDITARKNAEASLRASEATLRRTEDQLRQAQKMEAVGRLAGGIAHDFNNVLSVILSLSELATEQIELGDPLREDLSEIHMAGRRAADITRQLLMFSRRQVLEPRVIDLNEVLRNIDKMLRRMVGEDVDLMMVPARSLGRVRVDPSSIEQVLMNLVVNARDAMPTGGKLTIETANVTLDDTFAQSHHGVSSGPHVMLAVTDTGFGMDKDTQARIFEPFFTTKELGKGTGLGLSTVFGIVQQAQGSVWVYSEPEHGTTFKVYLPRVDDNTEGRPATVIPAQLHGTETILLVEDADPVRAVARNILRRHGYNVVEARNGSEALALSARYGGTLDLLLTDVVMPSLSGPALARQLTEIHPKIKILCMSGYTDDSVVRHGVLAQQLAYIQKPFTPETLARKVREVLDGG